jgi:hypothetical protein
MEPESESQWIRSAGDHPGRSRETVEFGGPGTPRGLGDVGRPGAADAPAGFDRASDRGFDRASDRADDWTVSLDGWTPDREGPGVGSAQRDPVRLGRWLGAGLLIAVLAASVVIWGPDVDSGEDSPPVAAVLGRHLAVPIALTLPDHAVATADGSYVGVWFPAGGAVLVTVPTQVVAPSGQLIAMPADPADWLARHPSIFISRLRQVRVAGTAATQMDYRRAEMNAPANRFARLPLFCGWRTEPDPVTDPRPAGPDSALTASRVCTQVTADARVRATFVRLGGRTLLVEAVWRADGGTGAGGGQGTAAGNRMPRDLQRSYTALLAGLAPGAGRVAVGG